MPVPMADLEAPGALRCTIQAPADTVFLYWTDPRLISRWVAPPPYQVREAEVDARVGGQYRIVMVGPAGDVHVLTGCYRELIPGRRLVKTWTHEGPRVRPGNSESVLTVDLYEPSPGVTELTVRRSQ
jgi:uncharacterized protein YndB with AHSA1/START domain